MPIGRLLGFLAVLATIVFGAHYYVWARLVRDALAPGAARTAATWAIATLGVLAVVMMPLRRLLPRTVASPLAWVAFTWGGLLFFALVLVGVTDLGRVIVQAVGAAIGASGAPGAASRALDPERRAFVMRAVAGAVAAGTLGLGGAAAYEALGPLVVKKVKVPLARLKRSLDGYTIVQLSDVHVGPTIGVAFIRDLVARVNALEPDLVAITGDLVDGSVEELGALVQPLAGLRAKDGVFFVTGNHEYYSGANEWVRFLGTLGVKVLRNERVHVRDGLEVAGVDDWTAHHFGIGHGADLPGAMVGRDPERTVVLLAHQPKAIEEAERHGVDLQLSGHTHGGQLFPFNFLVRLQQPYVAGLHEHGRAKIYVSRGTGYWGPPMRLGAPAEITRIELAPAVPAA
jgi:predicted MPP superfamily phosphohydrolase